MAKTTNQNKPIKTFKTAPLTLSIETKGGIATPLILRGTPLPTQRSQVFSTATDNQTSVQIAVLLGESPIARKNRRVATLTVGGIPKAPSGESKIQVTFDVGKSFKVTATGKLKGSGRQVITQSKEAQISLTEEEIKRLLNRDPFSRAEDDAEALIARAEAMIRENQIQGRRTKLDSSMDIAIASLGLALDKNNLEDIRTNTQKLRRLVETAGTVSSPFDFSKLDVFETFFGPRRQAAAPLSTSLIQRKRQEVPTEEPLADKQESQSQVAISGSHTRQLGKIFGGGEFTLDPNLCFVLMPFQEEMRPLYNHHIRVVVESEGISCIRADEIASTNLITSDIWEQINRARFIIADLTGRNANVFYEVGLAHALGKDIILLAQTEEDVPFDLRALRCILYSYTPHGMKDMETKLRKTIGKVMGSS